MQSTSILIVVFIPKKITKKTIDQMAQALQQNNLEGHILDNAKKQSGEQPFSDKGRALEYHALVVAY